MQASLWEGYDWAVRLGAFMAVFVAMALWEAAAPARVRTLTRSKRWSANLGLAVGNTLVARVVLPITAFALAALGAREGWGLLNRIELPMWFEIVLAVVALDLVVYFQHVLFHAVPMLARLHAVHHADPDFDLTTGIRFHPIEIVLSALIKLAAVAAIGASPVAVLIFEVLLNGTAMFNHANASLPAGMERFVRTFLVTPDMHRIHHSVVEAERNSNYGFCLSAWDRLFGTYTPAPSGPLEIGLANWQDPEIIATFSGAIGMPFRR